MLSMSSESDLPLSRFSSNGKKEAPLPYGSVQFEKEVQDNIQRALSSTLIREEISSRRGFGGKNLSYITGGRVIQKANEIFGFNGWSTSIIDMSVDYCDKIDGTYNTGVTCVIRVTLKDGAQREDIGFGHSENQPHKYSAIDKAKKEAVTDATKRALRLFGNQLGLCLYDKDFVDVIEKGPKQSAPIRDSGRPALRSFGGVALPQPISNRTTITNGTNIQTENASLRPNIPTTSFQNSNTSNPVGFIVRPPNQPFSNTHNSASNQNNSLPSQSISNTFNSSLNQAISSPSQSIPNTYNSPHNQTNSLSNQPISNTYNPPLKPNSLSNQPIPNTFNSALNQTNPVPNSLQARPTAPIVSNNSETVQVNPTPSTIQREESFLDFDDFDLSQGYSQIEPTNTSSLPQTTSQTAFSGISMSSSTAFTSAAASKGIASPITSFHRSPNSLRSNPTQNGHPHNGNPDPKRQRGT